VRNKWEFLQWAQHTDAWKSEDGRVVLLDIAEDLKRADETLHPPHDDKPTRKCRWFGHPYYFVDREVIEWTYTRADGSTKHCIDSIWLYRCELCGKLKVDGH
jgi:Zn-finger protein